MTISHMDTYKAINLIDTLLIRQLKRYTLHILVLVSISTLVVRLDCVVYFYDFIFFLFWSRGFLGCGLAPLRDSQVTARSQPGHIQVTSRSCKYHGGLSAEALCENFVREFVRDFLWVTIQTHGSRRRKQPRFVIFCRS